MDYVIRRCALSEVDTLCVRFHGYKGAGRLAVYAFGVFEGETMVAGYAWMPPPPGSAMIVAPSAPGGVLSLSRMVAVPREQRMLNHVSRPLRHQMKYLIDRTRWPSLVTYSDEGEGHTGHVYKCSGWAKTGRESYPYFVDAEGRRCSSYRCGTTNKTGLTRAGESFKQRWEHHVSDAPAEWMAKHGWHRVAVAGKTWKSGRQAYTWVKSSPQVSIFDDLAEMPRAC